MNIFIYSDESGVFDREHNEMFVFGGLMFLSKEERDNWSRKYIAAENIIRQKENCGTNEVKASGISNASKGKLFRALNNAEKFGVVVHQKKLKAGQLFAHKKSKQRYLDWAYKISVKRKFESLIEQGKINPQKVERLYFFVDQHTTATDGRYELKESLEQEFKIGTFNYTWTTYYPPIFPNIKEVQVEFCDSKAQTLVRAADIVANKLYFAALHNQTDLLRIKMFSIFEHP